MSSIVDSYSESNSSTTVQVNATQHRGQGFTGNGGTLDIVRFYFSGPFGLTGTANAIIYAHSGTFGSTGVPTGSALATSDNFDATAIANTAASLRTFTFSGANRITLTNGTKYFVVLNGAGISASFIPLGADSSSPTHAGNMASDTTGSWSALSSFDACFYVYGDVVTNSNFLQFMGPQPQQ